MVVVGNTTESLPVPNVAPTAIRRQNSYVAMMNGMTPMMNTRIVVSLDSIPILLSFRIVIAWEVTVDGCCCTAASESSIWNGISSDIIVIIIHGA